MRKLEGERFPWSEVAFCVYEKVAENEREVIEERIQVGWWAIITDTRLAEDRWYRQMMLKLS